MTAVPAQSMWAEARQALSGRGRELWALGALAFLTIGSYEIARPAVESLFLETYSQAGLPWVWLSVAGSAVVVVALFNRLATRVPIARLLVGTTLSCIGVLVLLMGCVSWGMPGATFALYIFKDLYVVVIVETFWSMADLYFPSHTARWAYGLFCGAGSIGSIVGGVTVGRMAAWTGTLHTLWLVVGMLALVALGAHLLSTRLDMAKPTQQANMGLKDALRVLTGSPYLGVMVALVACTQVAITLIDYEFNGIVSRTYPNLDERTQVIGIIYSVIAAAALVLQLSTGPVLKFIGVSRTLLGLPALLLTAVAAFLVTPVFGVMAVAKIASKAFDYSLFRASKEMLYIPLSYREKTEGKAVVDILTYRVAKGGVSLLLLGVAALSLSVATSAMTMVAIALWLGITVLLTRRYERRLQHQASATQATPAPSHQSAGR